MLRGRFERLANSDMNLMGSSQAQCRGTATWTGLTTPGGDLLDERNISPSQVDVTLI